MKKILLTISLFLIIPFLTQAKVKKDKDYSSYRKSKVSAYSAVVIDKSSGKILFSKKSTKKNPAASITKIVSAYAFLSEKPNLGKKSTMKRVDEVGGGRLRLPIGSKLSSKEYLYAALTGSANNSATALMRLSKKNNSEFIKKMNTTAEKAGAEETTFVDPSGISAQNISTPYDLALIGKKVFSKKLIRKACSKKNYTITANGGRKKISHTSPIVKKKSKTFKVRAAKTGYLPEIGHNLIADIRGKKKSGSKKGKLIVVVMGAKSQSKAAKDVERLSKWALKNYDWK